MPAVMSVNPGTLLAAACLAITMFAVTDNRAMAANPAHGVAAAAPARSSLDAPEATETFNVGTFRVQRYGDHGRPLILVPGLEGGSWAWRSVITHFRGNHVIYAVTLAGFDGVPRPKDTRHLMQQANASLLELVHTHRIRNPVLVGHSMGGTLAIAFAQRHSPLISGVIAIDGLPIMPGTEQLTAAQRKAYAAKLSKDIGSATPEQYRASILSFMQRMGTISAAKARRYARLNARSDQVAVAEYAKEDAQSDYRKGMKNIRVPLLEISPYYAPDFANGPMAMTDAQKAEYYRRLLAGAATAEVVSISPSRHFVMLDQPVKLNHAIAKFLRQLQHASGADR